MKKTLILAAVAAAVLMPAHAYAQNGESQIFYPPYMAPSVITQQDLIARQNYILMEQDQQRITPRTVDRDPTITYQGYIPNHPGDYRDAYDRGELPNLGGASQKTGRPVMRPHY